MRRRGNRTALRDALAQAVHDTAEQLGEAFQDTIQEKRVWDGFENRTTHRSNGEVVVGAYRNIVDSSSLKDSQTVDVDNDGTITYTWGSRGTTNAVDVFFGHRTTNSFIPGRDWVSPTIAEINPVELFKENFRP